MVQLKHLHGVKVNLRRNCQEQGGVRMLLQVSPVVGATVVLRRSHQEQGGVTMLVQLNHLVGVILILGRNRQEQGGTRMEVQENLQILQSNLEELLAGIQQKLRKMNQMGLIGVQSLPELQNGALEVEKVLRDGSSKKQLQVHIQ
jgi:hypothetical protein